MWYRAEQLLDGRYQKCQREYSINTTMVPGLPLETTEY